MKSALPQQAPTPIKMKSVTLLNKREKPYILVKPKLIEKESANEQENGCANAQLNPLLCSRVRGLFNFNKARVEALTFFGFPKIEYF